jgi:hypothetical protein
MQLNQILQVLAWHVNFPGITSPNARQNLPQKKMLALKYQKMPIPSSWEYFVAIVHIKFC